MDDTTLAAAFPAATEVEVPRGAWVEVPRGGRRRGAPPPKRHPKMISPAKPDMDDTTLAAAFPAATEAQWRALVDGVLKGADFEKRLVRRRRRRGR
jgi:hypothetical protein